MISSRISKVNLVPTYSAPIIARAAAAFYMVTVVTALFAFFPGRGSHFGHVANLVAAAAYLCVTFLFYGLFEPVNPSLSLLAAFFGIVGAARTEDSTFFFAFYCALIGYLVYKSTFIPKLFGVLMVLAGLGLLTNILASLFPPGIAHVLSPVGLALDTGEIVLALWLLIAGVDEQRWTETAMAVDS